MAPQQSCWKGTLVSSVTRYLTSSWGLSKSHYSSLQVKQKLTDIYGISYTHTLTAARKLSPAIRKHHVNSNSVLSTHKGLPQTLMQSCSSGGLQTFSVSTGQTNTYLLRHSQRVAAGSHKNGLTGITYLLETFFHLLKLHHQLQLLDAFI